MMTSSFLKMSRKQAKYRSFFFLEGTKEYGISFTGTDGASFLASLAIWLLVLEIKTSPSISLEFFFFFYFFIFLFF